MSLQSILTRLITEILSSIGESPRCHCSVIMTTLSLQVFHVLFSSVIADALELPLGNLSMLMLTPFIYRFIEESLNT